MLRCTDRPLYDTRRFIILACPEPSFPFSLRNRWAHLVPKFANFEQETFALGSTKHFKYPPEQPPSMPSSLELTGL
jgi:hypothetical protein